MRNPPCDKLDRELLVAVQHDGALTNEQLSRKIGLSPSAIQRRLRRLEATGTIERRVAIVDPSKVGYGALFVVAVEVERERQELVQPLRAWLRFEPAIQQAYYVTGGTDYVLIVTARDIGEFDSLMSRMMVENKNIRRFTTNVVMSAIKRGLFVPVA
ncbi:MAG: Lrp/AsnC family transcriptional regulator [Sphingomonas sp.]|nr:Lrp/AsnC family transcriptional regulator [Sphingomonas sp.]